MNPNNTYTNLIMGLVESLKKNHGHIEHIEMDTCSSILTIRGDHFVVEYDHETNLEFASVLHKVLIIHGGRIVGEVQQTQKHAGEICRIKDMLINGIKQKINQFKGVDIDGAEGVIRLFA